MRHLRYRFDNLIARGTWAMIGLLAVVALAMAVVGAAAILTLAPNATDLPSALWSGLMRTMSPGVVTRDSGSPVFLGCMLVLALTGIVIFSTLIGLIETGLDRKLASLRKGRSLVIERDHTVILGWSEQVFLILSELAVANASRGRTCVAILADRDRVSMEEAIRDRVDLPRRLRVVCRTGSPTDPMDVAIVSPERARAVIVLGSEDTCSDARTIKSLLALDAAKVRPRVQLVAGIRDPDNLVAARLAGGANALILDVDEISARVMVQTCLHAGLSMVYSDLLGFEGDEIYFRQPGELAGESFGDALPALENCSLIGLEREGKVLLNPAGETTIDAGDRLILIMDDDDAKPVRASARVDHDAIVATGEHEPVARRVLVLGWNACGAAIVAEFDHYMPPGSQLKVVADDSRMTSQVEGLSARVAGLTLSHETGDITRHSTLQRLDLGAYDHVLILADDRFGAHVADSRTLLTLLHVREMSRSNGWRHSLVTEIARDGDRRLVEVTEVDDFIVSSKVTSLLMIQVAENPRRHDVFADLFDAGGQEIYIRPADDYVRLSTPVDYATVVAAARAYGEVAIGYRTECLSGGAGGIALNPPKSRRLTFEPGDAVIVLAGGRLRQEDGARPWGATGIRQKRAALGR
ncbi:CASTOR/POLLUX-related putative ion channel [Streptosporangium carneum]|uniref:Lipoprotein n=1 Tax=Streptosporangium carneum TaxID=47481 RepID=A0A9W6MGM0_9ACTN|nr:TrkA C-terminal domain-containing protein [Streptosporangium carneum]GLK13287.1 lipoprotein [Streptosporangium carneum]